MRERFKVIFSLVLQVTVALLFLWSFVAIVFRAH